MGTETKISWCHHTFNPWLGCTKVHAGCTHCYAEADMDKRRGRVKWGANGTRSMTSPANWKLPLKWNREAEHAGERRRVFCASLADVFEDWQGPILNHKGERLAVYNVTNGILSASPYTTEPPSNFRWLTMSELRLTLGRLIDATPNLDWLLVTKRPENIRRMYLDWHLDGGTTGRIRELMHECESQDVHPYWRKNVWLLTSVSDQATADAMIPELLKCRDLVPVLGVSAEPLLGPVDFAKWTTKPSEWLATCKEQGASYIEGKKSRDGHPEICSDMADKWLDSYLSEKSKMLDWIITGGESGPHARPCNVEWIRSIGEQCKAAGVAWFNKQLGSYPVHHGSTVPGGHWPRGVKLEDINFQTGLGFRVQLKDKKGGDPAEWPEDLQNQEFPVLSHQSA